MTVAVELPGTLELPEPIGPQLAWLDSAASKKVLRVGRRGSKTRFAFIAGLAGHGPGWEDGTPLFPGVLQGKDVVWLAQTYTNLSTVLWKEEIVPRMSHLPWIELNTTKHDVNFRGLGSLMLRSADREAIDSIRGIGKRLGGVVIDEAAHLDLRGALLDVILPALLDNGGWLVLMSTTNAGNDGGYDDTGAPQIPSYFNVIAREIAAGKRGPDWQEFYATAYDNPELDRNAIDALIGEYPPGSPKLEQEVFAKILETGVGLALTGLTEAAHLVPPFHVPSYWNRFAAFDWGYHHPWVLGLYAVDEDGQVYKVETVKGRLDLPDAIDATAKAGGLAPSTIVYAGPDVWRTRVSDKGRIKGEFLGPTVAEQLQQLGWLLVPAADARVAGLNNFRLYTHLDPGKPDVRPRFVWMDTPNNRAGFEQVRRMQIDPKNPEDALKVDADVAGRGGDDDYDETRYALMSRPLTARAPVAEIEQGRTLGYDYANRRPKERETAEQEMQKILQRAQPNLIGSRYSIPNRRGR